MTAKTITIIIGLVLVLVLLILLYLGLVTIAAREDKKEEDFLRAYYNKYGCYPWEVDTADDEIETRGDL